MSQLVSVRTWHLSGIGASVAHVHLIAGMISCQAQNKLYNEICALEIQVLSEHVFFR